VPFAMAEGVVDWPSPVNRRRLADAPRRPWGRPGRAGRGHVPRPRGRGCVQLVIEPSQRRNAGWIEAAMRPRPRGTPQRTQSEPRSTLSFLTCSPGPCLPRCRCPHMRSTSR